MAKAIVTGSKTKGSTALHKDAGALVARSPFEAKMRASLESKFVEIQKKSRVSSGSEVVTTRQSTGLLCVDLVLAGGIVPGGWYTNFGPEQSAKSTLAQQIMISCLRSSVPFLHYHDPEGSSGASDYLEHQMLTNGVKMRMDDLFGLTDHKGKVIKKGRVYYNPSNILEEFFDIESSFLRKLPDKVFLEGKWWYCFPNDKYGKEMAGSAFDKRMRSKYDRLYVEAPDGGMQALIILDSYPAMIPRDVDDDDFEKSGMAVQARAFSQHIARVKGKLRAKKVSVIGVNQLRLRPGFNMGNPEYEPCGEALKFASDARIRLAGRSSPFSKKPYDEEESVDGGKDVYRWVHFRAHKNKLSTPNLEGWQRIWVSDDKGRGRGFDPVADTYEYLKMTGQLSGKRNQLKIKVNDKVSKSMRWDAFKAMIVGNVEQVTKAERDCGLIKKGEKGFPLRKVYRKQMDSGEGLQMFFEQRTAAKEEDE